MSLNRFEAKVEWAPEAIDKVRQLGVDANWEFRDLGDTIILTLGSDSIGDLDIRLNALVERATERGIKPRRSRAAEIIFDSWRKKP